MTTRNKTKFTQKGVEAYRPKSSGYRVFDETVTGLYLYVGQSGSKSWYLLYTDRNNKRQSYRFGSFKQYSVTEARVEARKLLGQIANGKDPAATKRKKKRDKAKARARTLKKYLEGDYWEHYLSKRKDGKADQYRIKHVYTDFLERDMATITPDELIKHRTKRFNEGRKSSTLNRDRMAIHGLFNRAVKDDVIERNPAHKDVFEPLPMVDDKRVRYLGQLDEIEDMHDENGIKLGERKRFMMALEKQSLMFQTMVGLAMNTGCRRGELFNLKWSDVSLKRRELTVIGAVSKSRRKRVIPLNSYSVTLLETFLKQSKSHAASVMHISGLVFPSPITGGVLNNIKRPWHNLVIEGKLTDFRFHDLRHDFASRLVMQGVSLYEVRDLLGHASIQMTERYSHLADEQLRKAVEILC